MNIYVGNLDYSLSEGELKNTFSEYGEVTSVKIITDKVTGKAKGFGFVEMPDSSAAEKAINNLNGMEVKGRNLKVGEARPPERKRSRY